jgi:hypothetical protein
MTGNEAHQDGECKIKFSLKADDDVLAIALLMQERLSADRLVPVAQALACLAPALWGDPERRALELTPKLTSAA